MSTDDLARRVLSLERENRALQDQVRQLRQRDSTVSASGSRTAVLQAVSDIAARTESGGTYSISHGPARLFDLIIPTAGNWELKPVVAGTTERTVELGNLWSDVITANKFIIAQTVQGAWLHGAEECD